eukprot:1654533-Amphidinium_carterae.1
MPVAHLHRCAIEVCRVLHDSLPISACAHAVLGSDTARHADRNCRSRKQNNSRGNQCGTLQRNNPSRETDGVD